MTQSGQAVTLHFPLSRMPAIITRLTTYLLDKNLTFLQTCYHAGHVDFDVVTQQNRSIIRVTMQATDESGLSPGTLAPTSFRSLTADAIELLHHLVQTETSTEST